MSGRFEDLDVRKTSMQLATDIYGAIDSIRDFGFRDRFLSRRCLSSFKYRLRVRARIQ